MQCTYTCDYYRNTQKFLIADNTRAVNIFTRTQIVISVAHSRPHKSTKLRMQTLDVITYSCGSVRSYSSLELKQEV